MKRMTVICMVASFVAAFAGTTAALTPMFPLTSAAHEQRIEVEELNVVGADGVDRIRRATGPGSAARIQVLDAIGTPRAGFATGGAQGTTPDGTGFQLFTSDGTQVMRLGLVSPQDAGRTCCSSTRRVGHG